MIDGVHIWRASLDEEGWPGPEELPPAEQRRADAFLRPEAARRWVAARWALRRTLARYLDRPAARIELEEGPQGKPGLRDRSAGIEFSLAHSAGLAVVAVTEGRQVGVDVEMISPRQNLVALAERVLAPAEAAAVRDATPRRQLDAFYTAWVEHEARVKCFGTGLGAPLPDAEIAVEVAAVGPEYAAAVAVMGSRVGPLRCRTLRAG